MITVVLTNRNRDLRVVKNCLDSLGSQSNLSFKVILIDYGSEEIYLASLIKLVDSYNSITFIPCPVEKQLWNKSRAINIALQKCDTDYFFVADIDMIFHPGFIEKLYQIKSQNKVFYFQVGFLDEEESKKDKSFKDYKIKHLSSKDATGMTLYPTSLLNSINGFDEFYHGWGAEDTDVHVRLRNKNVNVNFYNEEIFILHQWHPKSYRSKDSLEPFHSNLERINHHYIQQIQNAGFIKANSNFEWGALPLYDDYRSLKDPEYTISITNDKNEVEAFISGTLLNLKDVVISVNIVKHPSYKKIKNELKKIVGKKHYKFLSFDTVNDIVLLKVASCLRNQPYEYEYLRNEKIINLKIKL
ncbi:glycosyltransferase family 2 protein [Flavobacterium olei]|uniref:glycosyltransferase family 2 protein n=1 Tax=Flavobacterium olei TaxID=1886782 RepID=UPI00321A7C4F